MSTVLEADLPATEERAGCEPIKATTPQPKPSRVFDKITRRMVVCLVYSDPATVVNDKVEPASGDPLIMLVLKSKPKWQAGKYNGPGGVCEIDESFNCAASRETLEEKSKGSGSL